MRLDWFRRKKLGIIFFSFLLGYFTHYFIGLTLDYSILTHSKDRGSIFATGETHAFLVIIIFSSAGNVNRRQTIRQTWLLNLANEQTVKYFFVISSKTLPQELEANVIEEQMKNGDLLLFHNIEDSFYHLTAKLVASFAWLSDVQLNSKLSETSTLKPFKSFSFVMKCDDDSFVRVNEIVNELKLISGTKADNLYWGFFDGRAEVKKAGKYSEGEWVICDKYMPYALGGGYVVGKKLVQFVANNGDVLKRYKSEDISLGAWLGSYYQINRVHDPRFDTEFISRGCHQTYLVTHKHSENAILKYHDNLQSKGTLCHREYRVRLSYVYNWTVPPSKCCSRKQANIP